MKDFKVYLMGLSHLLVSFTSIVVVTRVLNFNIPVAFLMAGIGTLVFHYFTHNKLPVVLGVSGLYIGSILYVTQTYGRDYAMGGIMIAGLVYIVFGLIMLKHQDLILALFPQWLLSTAVLLIGLNLLPIGVSMLSSNYLIGITSLFTVMLVDMFGGRKLSLFSMPIGVLTGTLVAYFMGYIDGSVLSTPMNLEISLAPKFRWESILAIAPLSLAVIMEMMGDIKNTSDIIGMDVAREVGIGRVAIGNGMATFIGGLFGANAYTTYSENTAFVMLSKYFNPNAQIITSILMILVSLVPKLPNYIMLIPSQALGGVVTYLFAMIVVNSIKQLAYSGVDLRQDHKVFSVITIMLAISMLTIKIGVIQISSVAVAVLIGIVLNILLRGKTK